MLQRERDETEKENEKGERRMQVTSCAMSGFPFLDLHTEKNAVESKKIQQRATFDINPLDSIAISSKLILKLSNQ